jgi:predicted nucleic acid-binding protein
MSANGRSFVDTNVLVYAHDTTAGAKRAVAQQVVRELWETGRGCVSVQVLQEFFVTLTRKVGRPLETRAAAAVVADLATWTLHAPDGEDVLAAIDLHDRHRVSFWDAMIVRSASVLGCERILSEDLGHGERYDDAEIVNPFAAREQ